MANTRYTLTHDEFQAQLQDLGLTIGLSTLKRWAYEGIIEKPERYKKGKGGKRGRAVKWAPQAVEEACAVWAVRNSNITKALPSKSRVEEIKHAASRVYQYPYSFYSLWGPRESYFGKDSDDSLPDILAEPNIRNVTMKLVEDEELHSLITTWIAATEKARNRWIVHKPARVIFNWYSVCWKFGEPPVYDIKDHLEMPWDRDNGGDINDYRLERVILQDAEEDEITFLIDGEDSRKHVIFG